jgi:hypothetical protein
LSFTSNGGADKHADAPEHSGAGINSALVVSSAASAQLESECD